MYQTFVLNALAIGKNREKRRKEGWERAWIKRWTESHWMGREIICHYQFSK